MKLQENKAINLKIATPKISGILIRPGEVFSFRKLVGNCSEKNGYKEGVIIKSNLPNKGIGGGLCQFTNLLHRIFLHSPLEIIEHHHHNDIDLFPDFKRQIPFGTGTSIMYNYLDYQVKNSTNQTFQLITYTDNKYLKGELRSDQELTKSYHIIEEGNGYEKENGQRYRNNEIYRKVTDKKTGDTISYKLILKNHAKVMYDEKFIKQ